MNVCLCEYTCVCMCIAEGIIKYFFIELYTTNNFTHTYICMQSDRMNEKLIKSKTEYQKRSELKGQCKFKSNVLYKFFTFFFSNFILF